MNKDEILTEKRLIEILDERQTSMIKVKKIELIYVFGIYIVFSILISSLLSFVNNYALMCGG